MEGKVTHEFQTAGVSSTAALTIENVTEDEDPIYNRPTAGERSRIRADKKSAEFIRRKQ